MMEKCCKYEALFVFGSQEDFKKHLEACPDCMQTHLEMEGVAALVKEVKPYLKKTEYAGNNKAVLKVAACFAALFISFWSISHYSNNINDLNREAEMLISSGHSMIADMGLPTDEYGLLNIENQEDGS